jgi:hypothetical protein
LSDEEVGVVEDVDDTLDNEGGVTAAGAGGGVDGTGLTEADDEAAGSGLAEFDETLPEDFNAASDEHPAIISKGRIKIPFIFFFMTATPF